tara:strand:+ start:130 stop:474 length:345 start_codon:yes stop_codon:yes gene_type:complete
MNEPIVYKTKNCAILSMHFEIQKSGETDVHAGNITGSVGRAVGRSIGKAISEDITDRLDDPEKVLANNSVALADAYNALIEEGWIPQSAGFSGAGSGRTHPQHEYIFVQIFTKK